MSQSSLSQNALRYIQAHLRKVENLPHPSEEWTAIEKDDVNNNYLEPFSKRGIIKKKFKTKNPSSRGRNVWMYQTDKKAYDTIQRLVEERDTTPGFLPCNHERFKTRDGKVICKSCDEVWTKEEVNKHNE